MEFPYMMRSAAVIISARDPQWANEAKTQINMMLTFADADMGTVEMGFTACPNDCTEHGPLLFQWALDQGNIKPWERRDVTVADLQSELDKLLPDVMLGLATPEELELAKLLRIQIKAMTA